MLKEKMFILNEIIQKIEILNYIILYNIIKINTNLEYFS